MLYLVFGRFFKLGVDLRVLPALPADRDRALHVLRRRDEPRHDLDRRARRRCCGSSSFPRLIDPHVSATLSVAITFGVNLIVVAVVRRLEPDPAAARLAPARPAPARALRLHARGRAHARGALRPASRHRPGLGARLQLLFYASPIIYPVGFLPPWAQTIAFLNPFTQVLQDIRALVLYHELPPNRITATAGVPTARRAAASRSAIAVAHASLLGLAVFRRESPWFAERV